MRRSKLLGVFAIVLLVLTACGRAEDETETGSPTTAATGDSVPADNGGDDKGSDTQGLDEGGFGDLGVVCKDGDPAPVTEETAGLTDTEVRIATFTDEGYTGAPGLNEEFHDTAKAFTDWCNSHGGINGRKIVLVHRDAKLSEFQQRILESCNEDFFMVGGGAVFDDSGQADRLSCGLPDIAGFMVTAAAAKSDLHLEPVPNPVDNLNVADLEFMVEEYPDATKKVWDFTGNLPTLKLVSNRVEEAATGLGFEVVHHSEYNAGSEANWKPFVQAAADAGAESLFWVGEPENLAAVLQAAEEIGWEPEFVRADANHYTPSLIELGGSAVDNLITTTTFYPFELKDENQATEQYLDLMEEFNPGGKVALLGAQGLSGWLLFVTAANECDAEGTFTRDCIYETASLDSWTAGGLHSPQDVAGNRAGECRSLMQPSDDGNFMLVEDFDTNEGPWNCDPDSVIDLTGDYGEGALCPSKAEDPIPSTCRA